MASKAMETLLVALQAHTEISLGHQLKRGRTTMHRYILLHLPEALSYSNSKRSGSGTPSPSSRVIVAECVLGI